MTINYLICYLSHQLSIRNRHPQRTQRERLDVFLGFTGVLWHLVGSGHGQSSFHGADLPPQHRGVAERTLPDRVCCRLRLCFLWLVRHGSCRGRFVHHGKRQSSSQRGADGHTHQRHDDCRHSGLTAENAQGFHHEEGGYGKVQADDDGCSEMTRATTVTSFWDVPLGTGLLVFVLVFLLTSLWQWFQIPQYRLLINCNWLDVRRILFLFFLRWSLIKMRKGKRVLWCFFNTYCWIIWVFFYTHMSRLKGARRKLHLRLQLFPFNALCHSPWSCTFTGASWHSWDHEYLHLFIQEHWATFKHGPHVGSSVSFPSSESRPRVQL